MKERIQFMLWWLVIGFSLGVVASPVVSQLFPILTGCRLGAGTP